jgi:cell division protein ZapA
MAVVTLRIGDLSHEVGCRDGGEARLLEAASLIDQRWEDARRASGTQGPQRTLLLASLMLADAFIEMRDAPPPELPIDAALGALASRLESLADALEEDVTPA